MFCLAVFELLRGAMEVWVPLKITPHNCAALRGIVAPGTEAARAVDREAGSAEAPAVVDIPSQAIKVGARLVSLLFERCNTTMVVLNAPEFLVLG